MVLDENCWEIGSPSTLIMKTMFIRKIFDIRNHIHAERKI